MDKILVLDADKEFAQKISMRISSEFNYKVFISKSADPGITRKKNKYDLMIINLDNIGLENKKIVNFLTNSNTPAILLTHEVDDNILDQIKQKSIIDYIVIKNEIQIIQELIYIISRLQKNKKIKILIVDDSKISRMMMRDLLHTQQFIILEADSGMEALKMLKRNPDTKLVIVDYNMQGMHGFDLTISIREEYCEEDMAIIGISAYGSGVVSAKFLKCGANDFILKPYSNEEFRCRINQNLEMIEYIEIIRRTANIDYLTNLYNRRYFFEIGKQLFANAARDNIKLTTAIIDIDNFKSINDTYGHDLGDKVIKFIAATLKNRFRQADVIARIGGDEFSLFCVNMRKEDVFLIFEEIRTIVSNKKDPALKEIPEVSISIGVTTEIADTFNNTMKKADVLLYKAKENGRNCTIVD